jgi:hypothetical protein
VGQLRIAEHREVVADGVDARIGREKRIVLRDQTSDGVLDAEIEGLSPNGVIKGSRRVALSTAGGTVADGKAMPDKWSSLAVGPKEVPQKLRSICTEPFINVLPSLSVEGIFYIERKDREPSIVGTLGSTCTNLAAAGYANAELDRDKGKTDGWTEFTHCRPTGEAIERFWYAEGPVGRRRGVRGFRDEDDSRAEPQRRPQLTCKHLVREVSQKMEAGAASGRVRENV